MEGFSYRNLYAKGEKIYFLRVSYILGTKEIIEAKTRTVEDAYMVACIEKTKQTIFIGVDLRDMIFTNRKLAVDRYNSTQVRAILEEDSRTSSK